MSAHDLITLHPADNVVVCRRSLTRGEAVCLGDSVIVLSTDVALGHKIASRPIPVGGHVIKYGMSIGSATREVLVGEWVHLHNLKSDYISTHTHDQEMSS